METNALYFGDNLKVLSERLPDGTFRFPSESVDLVYLDPPFNSNRDYSLIFKETSGDRAEAQIKAFEDTWHWGETARDALHDVTVTGVNDGRIPDNVGRMLDALVRGIGHNDMSAYLVMMTPRLVQMHRVLKRTGSLYLHCDPTASHYLKIMLDSIFGPERFLNEVVWRRTGAHGKTRRYGPIHDTILVYTKTIAFKWKHPTRPYMRGHVDEYFVQDERGWRTNYYGNVLTGSGRRGGESGQPWRGIDPSAKGRHWAIPGKLAAALGEDLSGLSQHQKLDRLYEMGHIKIAPGQAWPMYEHYLTPSDGQAVGDIWSYQPYTEGTVFGRKDGIDEDVRWLSPRDQERLGWQTQKPEGLLERIIAASTDVDDVVLDPFCGCGTALVAAQKLGRRWVGIDITHLSIAVMRARLMDSFGLADVPVYGVPADLESARMLAAESRDGRYEFQWWALGLVDAKPVGGAQKKGADRGIDGVLTFTERDAIQRILVSVKSGKPSLLHVKELMATLTTEKGTIGILVELDKATPEMQRAALEAGQYESDLWGGKYDRLQILTVEELLAGKKPNVPKFLPGYQKAAKIQPTADQQALDLSG